MCPVANSDVVRASKGKQSRATEKAIVHIYGEQGVRRVDLTGRDLWALRQLIEAGPRGCTSIDDPAPRWSGYIYNLRQTGFDIETCHRAASPAGRSMTSGGHLPRC